METETQYRFRVVTLGGHVYVDLFVGPAAGTRAKSGTLVFRAGEETALLALLRSDPAWVAGVTVVRGDPEEE